jgi:hypothetical protein
MPEQRSLSNGAHPARWPPPGPLHPRRAGNSPHRHRPTSRPRRRPARPPRLTDAGRVGRCLAGREGHGRPAQGPGDLPADYRHAHHYRLPGPPAPRPVHAGRARRDVRRPTSRGARQPGAATGVDLPAPACAKLSRPDGSPECAHRPGPVLVARRIRASTRDTVPACVDGPIVVDHRHQQPLTGLGRPRPRPCPRSPGCRHRHAPAWETARRT